MPRSALLVRYSEVAVKGRHTRSRMEKLLVDAISEALRRREARFSRVETPEGRVIVWDPEPVESAVKAVSRVFGVKSVSPAVSIRFSSLEELVERAAEFFAEKARGRVFRVRARRVGSHPFTSKDVERMLGARLVELGAGPVNLTNPEYTAYVEVRGWTAFLYDTVVPGPGGLPLGSEEPVLVLFSGGFDSTAAAWLVMKRGAPAGLAFYSLGVEEALSTAVEAARLLAREWVYYGKVRMYIVDFTSPMSVAASVVNPSYRLLVIRRLMMEHACSMALRSGYEALATGESIGQVASQTVRNLRLIGSSLCLPVLRPVSGMDKDEVVEIVRRIGLYELAARQVEQCRGNPTPRASPSVFEEELSRAKRMLGEIDDLPVETIELP